MTSLNDFAAKFREWRGSRRHIRYPNAFWDELKQLSSLHSLDELAKACDINLPYLCHKLKKAQPLKFAEGKVGSFSKEVSIEFINDQGRDMRVRFQADHYELIQLLNELTGQKA